jgi:hypothetical protein
MVEMVVCALADSMASSDSYSPSLRFSRFRSPTKSKHKVTHTAARISVADPWHFGVDPDPAIFVTDLQDANKKIILKKFSAYYFLKVNLHKFPKIKSQKEVTKQ